MQKSIISASSSFEHHRTYAKSTIFNPPQCVHNIRMDPRRNGKTLKAEVDARFLYTAVLNLR